MAFPTYHLAAIADDHAMRISHVLRAQEWVSSAPLHLLIFAACGWRPPRYAHLPAVNGPDGKKLAKRHGATGIGEFRRRGFLPAALVNYLALLGWSPGDDRELFRLDELERAFSLERLGRSGAVFDHRKLEWFNGQYIRMLSPQRLAAAIAPHLQAAGIELEDREQAALAALLRERLTALDEAPRRAAFLAGGAPLTAAELVPKRLTTPHAAALLRAAAALLQEPPREADDQRLEERLRELAAAQGVKFWRLDDDDSTGGDRKPGVAAVVRFPAPARRAPSAAPLGAGAGNPGPGRVRRRRRLGAVAVSMDTLVALCKRRGFIFPSSDVYGGLASAWDYGPLGAALKNRLRDVWWREMTQLHDNIVGIDAAILMHPRVWEASGHVANFTDPLVDCRNCKARFRADQLDDAGGGVCPQCGKPELTAARQFNLMFQTHLGPVRDAAGVVYLRPETAQGSYVNFKNVLQSSRLKIPFGIAQVGKAFRNEITTKSFIFRTCEFEQMEMQYFVHPGDDVRWFEHWKQRRFQYYLDLGIDPDNLRFHQHGPGELAHYARDAYDIQYRFPFGWQELEGIHNRTDYDLKRHMEFAGKDLSYLDETSRERYVPLLGKKR